MKNLVQSKVNQFKKALSDGINKIVEASKIYVEAIDSNPQSKRLFQEKCPDIPIGAWASFELVGRNAMDYRLMWGGGKAQSSIKKLPKSQQTEILDKGVLVPSGESERYVPVENLTTQDIKVVFSGKKIRSVDEQRALMAREKTRLENSTPDWYIHGRNIIITKPTKISLSAIKRMI